MKTRNCIVIPPYYSGTSFEDIVRSLKVAVHKIGLPVTFYGYTRPLSNNVTYENLLDDYRYVAGQLKILNTLIEEKDSLGRILFLDFFNPGLDLFQYSLMHDNRKIRIASLLHGGSFVSGDLYGFNWLKNFEYGWFALNNTIYVPSHYLRNSCPDQFKAKAKVFSWGMDAFKPSSSNQKKWDVVFPHRLQKDKGVEEFVRIIKLLPRIKILVTSPLTRQQLSANNFYYKLKNHPSVQFVYRVNNVNIGKFLCKSKIVLSCSLQETFGYSIMKSIASGCVPVVPDRACYPEYIPSSFRYKTMAEAVKLIEHFSRVDLYSHEKFFDLKKNILQFSFTPILRDFFK